MLSQEAEQGASRRRCMQATLWRSCWPARRRFWTWRIDIRLSPIYCRFVIYLFPRFLKELFVFTGSQRWIHFASVPPPSASSNEWVPVFRAQPAAMNKMAFKAFFITAFSQTERDGCRASDKSRPGGLNYFISLMVKNLYSAYLRQNVSKKPIVFLVRVQYVHLIPDNMVGKGCCTSRLWTRGHANYRKIFIMCTDSFFVF